MVLNGRRDLRGVISSLGCATDPRAQTGENLAMENEKIHFLPVREVNADYDMNAVVILDER